MQKRTKFLITTILAFFTPFAGCDFVTGHGGCGFSGPLGWHFIQYLTIVDGYVNAGEYGGVVIGAALFLFEFIIYSIFYYFIVSILAKLYYKQGN